MKAIVFADRSGAELKALCAQLPPALLPVAGRPLIEYTLDELAAAGVTEAVIFAGRNKELLRARISDGARWGLALELVASRGDEHPQDLIARLGRARREDVIMLRGDVLRTPSLVLPGPEDGDELTSTESGTPMWAFARNADGELAAAFQPGARPELRRSLSRKLAAARCTAFGSVAEFLTVQQHVLAGRFGSLELPGLKVGHGVLCGAHSRRDPGSHIAGPGILGRRSTLGANSRLGSGSIVCDDCHVDRDSQLRRCVVFPGTYVGPGLRLSNVVVTHDGLIVGATGELIPLQEPTWVANLSGRGGSGLADRLCALVLTVPAAPIALVLALASTIMAPRRPLLSTDVRIGLGGRAYRSRRFRIGPDWARALPGLIDVLSGRLQLFGTRPRTQQDHASDTENWLPRRPGLMQISRRLLNVSQADPDERELIDALLSHESPLRRLCTAVNTTITGRCPRPSH